MKVKIVATDKVASVVKLSGWLLAVTVAFIPVLPGRDCIQIISLPFSLRVLTHACYCLSSKATLEAHSPLQFSNGISYWWHYSDQCWDSFVTLSRIGLGLLLR